MLEGADVMAQFEVVYPAGDVPAHYRGISRSDKPEWRLFSEYLMAAQYTVQMFRILS